MPFVVRCCAWPFALLGLFCFDSGQVFRLQSVILARHYRNMSTRTLMELDIHPSMLSRSGFSTHRQPLRGSRQPLLRIGDHLVQPVVKIARGDPGMGVAGLPVGEALGPLEEVIGG